MSFDLVIYQCTVVVFCDLKRLSLLISLSLVKILSKSGLTHRPHVNFVVMNCLVCGFAV